MYSLHKMVYVEVQDAYFMYVQVNKKRKLLEVSDKCLLQQCYIDSKLVSLAHILVVYIA